MWDLDLKLQGKALIVYTGQIKQDIAVVKVYLIVTAGNTL
jgi:hypothetical protein